MARNGGEFSVEQQLARISENESRNGWIRTLLNARSILFPILPPSFLHEQISIFLLPKTKKPKRSSEKKTMSAPVVKLDFLRAGSRGNTMSYGGAMPNMHMPMQDHLESAASVSDALGSGFMLPPVADPALYARTNLKTYYGEDNEQMLKFEKGTTTLAFIYNGGIVVAVDSRSTMGPFVSSGQVKKVNQINEYMLATLAGTAADCQYWQRNLAVQCRMYELRNRHRISVRAASKLISNTCNYYKRYGMSLGMMLMGYDNGEPALYYVDDEGSRFRASETIPKFSVGSGSTYAYGVLDNNWRWDLTDDEAVKLGQDAIYHATHRDAYSGGICNVYVFKPEGFRHVVHKDVDELHDHFRTY